MDEKPKRIYFKAIKSNITLVSKTKCGPGRLRALVINKNTEKKQHEEDTKKLLELQRKTQKEYICTVCAR